MRTNRWAMTIFLVVVGLAESLTICRAVDLPKEFPSADGYTLRIPSDWIPIPKEVLDGYSEQMVKTVPGVAKQTYNQGFQLAASKGWLTYPYILVQNVDGRLSDAILEKTASFKKGMESGMDKTQQISSGLFSGAKVGEPKYDATAHILWTPITTEVKSIGTVKGLMAVLLTEKGTIRITGVAKADEYDKYSPLFEAIARGATVAPELQYKPSPAASMEPWESDALWCAFGLFVLYLSIRRKRAMRPV